MLAYTSLSLWSNLLYFARIWESTGMYIVLFKKFTTGVAKFIFLIIVFVGIAADYFHIIGSSNIKINPENKQYYDAPIPSFYNSIKLSIFWGMLAQDDISGVNQSDSKVLLIIVWFILSLIIALILLNLLVAVIGWLFEEILEAYVQSNQLAKAQLLSVVQNIMVGRIKDTSIADKFLVTAFYPSMEGELEHFENRQKKVFIEQDYNELLDSSVSDSSDTQQE